MVFLTIPRVAIRPANETARSVKSLKRESVCSRLAASLAFSIRPKRSLISGNSMVSMPASTATSKKGTGTTATPAENLARFYELLAFFFYFV